MNIRLYHARILTMEENREIFWGEIWIKNEKIVYIGEDTKEKEWPKGEFPRITWDIELDCKGNLLMPGFKNAHTHSGMTFLRSYADDLPLQEWLQQKVFPMEAKLTPEDIYYLTKLAILEYLTTGVTAIFDMYLDTEAIAEACLDMGMRCVIVSGLNNFSSSIEQVESDYLRWNLYNPLVSYQLGFHAEYTCSKELLRKVADLAKKYQAPVYTHLSETKKEVEECRERYKMTPVEFLDSLGIFEFGGGGYHCIYTTPEDLEIMKKRKLYVITNPASNIKLASGIAPIAKYIRHNIPVAIGTDGPASNNCLDMFREMFLVTALQKLSIPDAAAMDAMEVLRMATVGGAHAMCLPDCDTLTVGKYADLIMIDLQQPNMQPLNNIAKNLVYSGSKQNIKMTMVNGRILYEDGEFHIGVDPAEVYQRANASIERMQA